MLDGEAERIASFPPSEDRDTEWNDEVDEACTWPCVDCRRLDVDGDFDNGG